VRSPASIGAFRQFVSALEDKTIEVTNADIGSLCLLRDEFWFMTLSERFSAFRRTANFIKRRSQWQPLSAMEERPLERHDVFQSPHQEQKSVASALTAPLVRPPQVEPDVAAAPRIPEPVQMASLSRKATARAALPPCV
jgi:hypothetical protein